MAVWRKCPPFPPFRPVPPRAPEVSADVPEAQSRSRPAPPPLLLPLGGERGGTAERGQLRWAAGVPPSGERGRERWGNGALGRVWGTTATRPVRRRKRLVRRAGPAPPPELSPPGWSRHQSPPPHPENVSPRASPGAHARWASWSNPLSPQRFPFTGCWCSRYVPALDATYACVRQPEKWSTT